MNIRDLMAARASTLAGGSSGSSSPVTEFRRRLRLPDDDDRAWEVLSSRINSRMLFSVRNRKEFFLSLLTSQQPYDEILDDADGIVERRGHSADGETERRFDHVWWVGKGYWLTRHASYAEFFRTASMDLLESSGRSAHGTGRSIRQDAVMLINLVIGYCFFSDSPVLSPAFWLGHSALIHRRGALLERRLRDRRAAPEDRVLISTALIVAGVYFADVRMGTEWIRRACNVLRTVCMSGVNEAGEFGSCHLPGQLLVAEALTIVLALGTRASFHIPEVCRTSLERLLRYVDAISRQDGSIPTPDVRRTLPVLRIRPGADDNTDPEFLNAAFIVAGLSDQRGVKTGFDQLSLWLVGAEAFEIHRTTPERADKNDSPSLLFRRTGIGVLRSRTRQVTVRLRHDPGGPGDGGTTGQLGVDLWTPDGLYLHVPSGRDQAFVRGASHDHGNAAVLIDGSYPMDRSGRWFVRRRRATSSIMTGTEQDTIAVTIPAGAFHDKDVRLRREYDLDKLNGDVVIRDTIEGYGKHEVILTYYVHPDVVIEETSPGCFRLMLGEGSLEFSSSEDNAIRVSVEGYDRSGHRIVHQAIRIRYVGPLPHQIVVAVRDERASEGP